MIYLYSDMLGDVGGIESYLYALALRLHRDGLPFRVFVVEMKHSLLLDELVSRGISVVRQQRIPGDRWLLRQRILLWRLVRCLQNGDWVFCVREPIDALYLGMVRKVHRQGARLAASWMLSPEFLPPLSPHGKSFVEGVRESDAVISVSRSAVPQFRDIYGYDGPVHVVRYHNLISFDAAVPLPEGPPWRIGYIGRISMHHKNLDSLVVAFSQVALKLPQVELHLFGDGPDTDALQAQVQEMGLRESIIFHGGYDHRRDLPRIMSMCHLFTYPSRMEGGPSVALLEILQAGRFCVAAAVGGAVDIYENKPEIGALVSPGDIGGIAAALIEAVRRVAYGKVEGEKIRARYFEEFDSESAHRDWLKALGLKAS